ncbi:MAG TPA: aminotransferase class IV [Phycisphaerales bacterium]|nr:aminotransferase class IV [Phycisphaerales bacterium]HMP38604.1 aminotransferase class IV [Phycisphaerales bacterium]
MLVFLNGAMVERDAARISAFDAGAQHGIGLFETMLAREGVLFRAERHVRRLVESARELGLSDSLRVEPLVEAVHHVLERNALAAARMRLTVTGGDLNFLHSGGRPARDPTILISAQPPTIYPEAFFEQGVVVMVADPRATPFDPFAGHKTIDYWRRIRVLQQVGAAGGSEALWFTVTNHLASGSVSNVFLVRDGTLLTPFARGEEVAGALRAPVLPGIQRETVIELAEGLGLAVERRMLAIEDVFAAEEIFLTNSSWGVLPVRQVEAHVVGRGAPGPITAALRRRWLDLVGEAPPAS